MDDFLEAEIFKTLHMFTDRDVMIKRNNNNLFLYWLINDDQDGIWDMFESNKERLGYFGILKDTFDNTYVNYELYVKYTLGPVVINNNIYSEIILTYINKDHSVTYAV